MAESAALDNSTEPLPPVAAWRWLAAFGLSGSAAGWLGQFVWSGWAFLLWAVAWELIWGAERIEQERRRARNWETGFADLFYLFPVTLLVSILMAAAMIHVSWAAWYLVEIALGAIAGTAVKSLLGAIFGASVGSFVWLLLRRTRLPQMPRREISMDEEVEILRNYNLQVIRRCIFFAVAIVIVALGWVGFASFTGVRDESLYPPMAQSPYLLPFPAGRTYFVCQGNRGVVSHRDWEEFAYDFAMPVGSDVCAARSGTVIRVVDSHDGHGLHAMNNQVEIDHGDGTIGKYLHIKRGGSYVRLGDRVVRGQRIAASGHVGLSMLPHLHFVVDNAFGISLPVTFADVPDDHGIPRMLKRYTSGNASP